MKRLTGAKRLIRSLLLFLMVITIFGCQHKPRPYTGAPKEQKSKPTQRSYVIKNVRYYPIPNAVGFQEQGRASWYGKKFHGRKTANGERYDMFGDTAAHKTLPMNTILRVKNLENGKSIVVRVNDRGPFVKNRIIDLTYTGAQELDMVQNGTAKVEITALQTQVPPTGPQQQNTVAKKPSPNFDKGKFYVQVGAFVQLANARRLAKDFADKGRDVLIQQYPAAGMQLYRVMIYTGTSLNKARKYEAFLEGNGFPSALVINAETKSSRKS